ncbi:hypothetical protein E2C01_064058 [Portunus trituberculatus]|uniref:Uncharacterized protein n=1 Tax=Portunus trituberculatus TaxID=210409 RepID=A0A5B7HKQ3_PORTR|nr:hypothetical protein [Portunus trituberculatus]
MGTGNFQTPQTAPSRDKQTQAAPGAWRGSGAAHHYLRLHALHEPRHTQLNEGTNWEHLLIIPPLIHLSGIN